MNYIDEKFINLIKEIESKSEYEIYVNILSSFKKVPTVTQNSLEKFLNKFKYWGDFNIAQNNYEVFYLRTKMLTERLQDWVSLYNKLEDFRSKYLLFAILNNIYNFDFVELKNSTEYQFKHYFDLNLLPKCENDVFVDVGTYTGDTVLDFISSYGENYKKIYCYEMTKDMHKYINENLKNFKNIEIKQKAVADKNKTLYINTNEFSLSANTTCNSGENAVEAVSLDEDIKEPISLIKMDIEGGEKDAIVGATNHIVNETPKLLLSVYHGNTDILDIPIMIDKLTDKYNYHLRYYGGCAYPTEIVLFCLPKL